MKVLLAPMRWTDSWAEPWPASKTQRIAEDMRSYWQEVSYGRLLLDITIAPWTTAEVVSTTATCSTPNLFFTWFDRANTGIRTADFNHVMFITPRVAGCAPKGLCYSAFWSWINAGDVDLWDTFAPLHEYGHSLGLAHAGTLRINNYPPDGTGSTLQFPYPGAPWGNMTAQTTDTGDFSDILGYNPLKKVHISSAAKHKLGWITPAIFSGGDVTYNLTPLAQPGGNLYCVYIKLDRWVTGSLWKFWIDYRTAINWDSALGVGLGGEGVLIHFAGGFIQGETFALLDAHCETEGAYDSFFHVGDSFSCGPIRMAVTGLGQIRVWDTGGGTVNTPPAKPAAPLTVTGITLLADIQK